MHKTKHRREVTPAFPWSMPKAARRNPITSQINTEPFNAARKPQPQPRPEPKPKKLKPKPKIRRYTTTVFHQIFCGAKTFEPKGVVNLDVVVSPADLIYIGVRRAGDSSSNPRCQTGVGCLPQPRWALCATGAGAHQGQTSREGEKDIWWTAGTARGGTGHLGLTRTETQRGRLRTACGQRRVDSKNSHTTPATTSTSSIRQLLGAADAQTAHHVTFSTAPTHQLLGSANAETTPARAPAAAADRTQRPDATCEGNNG